ncbi:MAG: RES family NAD+ phosphorylase [Bosea sp.]|uniref:RES family NAD+ phosphorylase n=1 Tax=Bosea spartocytisi TaxID=2773451 RepID=A0A927I183_9HYPH|nr:MULTISPECIES: RES family NAD+ phosphorylase [Bosea]MCP4559291.1 RES family NAD+ phosphorylase [Bosea sp. (in: a-proteobacteria)]PZR82183.1 MAG: RES domain-containing protein [Stutzerimonas stutzeri]MBD3847301.1 RES family NAD+ phosphorylase [Bosea spartocytisi]MCP4733892.1 RES family NAD+ phosphorylase [Bosea sp. (in: a-proteobacteria)]MCT4475413.1 RES family NAD+ phosphorylase [Bosea spartocytisi]
MPPLDFASRRLKLTTLGPGRPWYRLYESRHPDALGFGYGSSRFSAPEAGSAVVDRFGVVYFGSSMKVCFAEAILRDAGVGMSGLIPFEMGELERYACAEVVVTTDLYLVDLRGDGLVQMRMPTDAARARDHRLGQQWSRAFWLNDARPDGIIYESRLNGEANIAVYDRALSKLGVSDVRPMMERREEMAGIIDDFELAIVR